MAYQVLRKGKVIMTFSTEREALRYIKNQTGWFSGESVHHYHIRKTGCYLTTAAVDYMGQPDDGAILTSLRHFRDSYLLHTPQGRKEVDHYYTTAPAILEKIDKSPDKEHILHCIYHQLVLPTYHLIQEKQYAAAHQHYKDFSLQLEKDLLANNQRQ